MTAAPVRHADPADGRSVRLSLTGAGRARQRQIGRRHARGVASAMTARLNPDELRQLEAMCLKLTCPPAPASDMSPANETNEDTRR